MTQRKILEVEVASDLYVAGRTEDGLDYTAEVFRVVFEYEGGEVWAHRHSFPGCKVTNRCDDPDDDGWGPDQYFEDVREAARAGAEKLCARVQEALAAGKELDLTHWYHQRNVYGSQAYEDECAMMTPRQLAGEE